MPHVTSTDKLKSLLRSALGMHAYEKLVFRYHLGYWPKLRDPTTFCEKIVCRKLYSRDERLVSLSDKVAVRDFVREKCGSDLLCNMYAILSSGSELPRDLPSDFFMKATFGSGINRRISEYTLDRRPEIMRLADDMLRQEHVYGRLSTQWWYERIPKRLMLEEVLHDSQYGSPLDFKLYCFNGRVRLLHVDFNRKENHTRSYFDCDWNFLPFTTTYPQGPAMSRPKNLEKMITIAEVLGREFDFVRVDLYNIDDTRIVFGEMTFAPDAGWVVFSPSQDPDWDLGKLWKLDRAQ